MTFVATVSRSQARKRHSNGRNLLCVFCIVGSSWLLAACQSMDDASSSADGAKSKLAEASSNVTDQANAGAAQAQTQGQAAVDTANSQAADAAGSATKSAESAQSGLNDAANSAQAQVGALPGAAGLDSAAATAKGNLFAMAGGKAKFDAIASDFVDFLSQNPKMMSNPAIAGAMNRDPAHHKQMLSDYLCRISGGPCTYSGKNMKDAHAGMKVGPTEWKIMGALFVKSLRKNNVPKPLRTQLINMVAANRPLIVDEAAGNAPPGDPAASPTDPNAPPPPAPEN